MRQMLINQSDGEKKINYGIFRMSGL